MIRISPRESIAFSEKTIASVVAVGARQRYRGRNRNRRRRRDRYRPEADLNRGVWFPTVSNADTDCDPDSDAGSETDPGEIEHQYRPGVSHLTPRV